MTSRAFTAGWLVAAALLSSWAMSSASDQRQVERPLPSSGAAVPASSLPALSVEVDRQTARLSERMQPAAAGAVPTRNLFSFAAKQTRQADGAPRAAHASPSSDVPAPAVVVDVPAAPILSGIAELRGGALTAVISFREELHYVKKGDVIAGRYRVDSISAEHVELFDLGVGTILRLSLQRLT